MTRRKMKPTPMFMLTVKSKNHKTGRVPVSTSPKFTCPAACPFKGNGCYAEEGPLNIWWMRCSDAEGDVGDGFRDFCDRVRALPEGQIWRHNQAGDLLGSDNLIDAGAAALLMNANVGKRGYTYTHYPVFNLNGVTLQTAQSNRRVIERMNVGGFTINVSANSPVELDMMIFSGLKAPMVVTLPESALSERMYVTPDGNEVRVCPSLRDKKITCNECQLCVKSDRKHSIGFPVHGKCCAKAEAMIRSCDEKWLSFWG